MLSYAFDLQDKRFRRAFAVLRGGMAEGAFPGASLAVAPQGKLVALKGLGAFTYEPESPAVTPKTIYDLASVTKVIATTPACMVLYERSRFKLDLPVVA